MKIEFKDFGFYLFLKACILAKISPMNLIRNIVTFCRKNTDFVLEFNKESLIGQKQYTMNKKRQERFISFTVIMVCSKTLVINI